MFKRLTFMLVALLLLSAPLLLPQSNHTTAAEAKTELIVSAAASLQDSLDEIAINYQKSNPSIKLIFNYGSSGTLQKQIEQGAPADLFLSAGKKQIDALAEKELLTSVNDKLVMNELVMIVSKKSKLTFTTVKELDKSKVKVIAIGQPDSVPAGAYAKETLTARKVWDTLEKRFVYAKDVRQVLTYVETGNAEVGFVYKTDALSSDKVKVALRIAADTHKPIVYPAAIIKASKHADEAKQFFDYLKSPAAQKVFASDGFLLP